MDTSTLKILFLLLLSVLRISEVSSKNNRIKIIVPHKISIIHHHHSRTADLKPKKKFRFDVHVHDILKSNQIHEEEESEGDATEEGRFGPFTDEADEASQKGVAYYAFPTTAYSNAIKVYMKPVFLYKESYNRRRPPQYEYHKYEDYNFPEETYQGNRYRMRGFQ